ncbi:hypothetical protein SNOG_13860 [Parastagonospora nodorum SN15]|uniref:Uncharacterized protein n=1 Tax=Phaeosphaeria nodorum (strain SN15 / ATCC MYA-4574 / FGSC 10173) TaxID=321614 RepID=Q0U304_PHANO|nr:hypothetical protein SNOG_13860 [Parastagonospora nodorum SN15]EAT78884.1 hypothetical protein SNOG_13860 [Parastagonospora nodorum SN15]
MASECHDASSSASANDPHTNTYASNVCIFVATLPKGSSPSIHRAIGIPGKSKDGSEEKISSSSSSSSSTSTGSVEEIPREKIPRAAPRFTKPEPCRFAPHPHMTTQPWATQTPHPQQWRGTAGGGGANDQPR